MAQSDNEIKIIPHQTADRVAARPISRDGRPRDLHSETPLKIQKTDVMEVKKEVVKTEVRTERRHFLKALLPASGKVLKTFVKAASEQIIEAQTARKNQK